MYTPVSRDQFDTRRDTIIHAPTGAEFTANPSSRDSFLIWTGELDRHLPSGGRYSCKSALNFKPFRHPSVTPDQPRVLMQIQNIAGCRVGSMFKADWGVKRHADSHVAR